MPDCVYFHSSLFRIALLVLAAFAALRRSAADEQAHDAERSVLAPSAEPEQPQFIDEQLQQQGARALEAADPHDWAGPPARHAAHSPHGNNATILEHLHALRRRHESLPPHFRHGSLHGRHLGIGEPLYGTSWLNRPWGCGIFVGGLFGDDLIAGRVAQHDGLLAGVRLGYDFDHFWGFEGRFAFANLDIVDQFGPPARNWYGDLHVLYYPWGDARWRPYASLGLGLAYFDFLDDVGQPVNTVLVGLPIGVGVKHQWKRWLTLRFDLVDNIAFGSGGMSTLNSVSLSAGLEWRFGGSRRSYWPYDPSINLQ